MMVLLIVLILVTSACWVDGQSPVCDQRDLRTLMVKINQLTAQTDTTGSELNAKLQETRLETTNLIGSVNASFRDTKGQIELTIKNINSSVRSLSDTILESEQNVNSSIDRTKTRLNTLYIDIQEISNKTDTINSTVKDINGRIKIVKDEIDRIKGLSQCPDGWVSYNRSCYFFSVEAKNFGDAAKACNDTGAHLVYVENETENNFLKSFLRTLKDSADNNFWIGIKRILQGGRWLWYNTSIESTYFDFTSGEPGSTDDCVHFATGSSYQWTGNQCSLSIRYICEKKFYQNTA